MVKIKIDRKAHHRSGYKRKGKYISGASVKRTIYYAKDRGKRGRTPKHKRWLKLSPKIKLGEGYTKKPAGARHARLRSLDRKKNISSRNVWNEVQGLANVQTNRRAKKVFKADAKWAMKNLMNKKEKKAMTAKARAAR